MSGAPKIDIPIPTPGADLTVYRNANKIEPSDINVEFLLEGVLLKGRVYEIFGKWKSGKTLITVDMAASISLGEPWAGMRTEKATVVYVAGESVDDIQLRLAAWRLKHGKKMGRFMLRTKPVYLTNDEYADILREEINALGGDGPVILIIDTLNRNFGGGASENSDEGMGAFITNLIDGVVRPTGATCIVVHHSGHGDGDRSRGHSSFAGAVDGSLKCAKDGSHITVTSSFMRSTAGNDSVSFRVVVQEFDATDNFGNPVDAPVVMYDADYMPPVKSKGLGKAQAKALATLRDLYANNAANAEKVGTVPRVPWSQWRDAMQDAGIARNKTYEMRDELKVRKLVTDENGFWTPAGEDSDE